MYFLELILLRLCSNSEAMVFLSSAVELIWTNEVDYANEETRVVALSTTSVALSSSLMRYSYELLSLRTVFSSSRREFLASRRLLLYESNYDSSLYLLETKSSTPV